MDEQQQSLNAYVITQIQSGQAPDEIFAQLQAAGWPAARVQQAFSAAHAQLTPAAMREHIPRADGAAVPPQANGQRRGRLRTGWALLKQSVRLLNGNRYLFRYLLMTWVVILAIEVILFGIIYFAINAFFGTDGTATWQWYVFAFVSYVLVSFAINFYAAALAGNIFGIFRGEKQPYHAYIALARSKAGPIFVFSVIQSIVGMFLQYVVERIRFVGWIIAWLLGTAWSLGTMFVLPILINSDTSAPQAIKQSIGFFKQTWGEGITAKVTVNAPLSLITILLAVVFWPLLFIAAYNGATVAAFALLIVYLLAQISLAIIGSFAGSVVNAALYYYATTHQIPPGFSSDMLNRVFVKKRGLLR